MKRHVCLKPEDLDNITVWGQPQMKVPGSGFGPVRFDRWCELEIERMTKAGHKVHLRNITRDSGPWIAISRGVP